MADYIIPAAVPTNNNAYIRLFENLPEYPRCTDDLQAGTRKCPKAIAIKRRYIQLNKENYSHTYINHDLDYRGAAFGWCDADLPPPTFCVINPDNAHAHTTYELEVPVHLGGNASENAIYYLHVVVQGYTTALDADPTYGGYLTKNPFSDTWGVHVNDITYDLDRLAEPLRDISWQEIRKTPLSELEAKLKASPILLGQKPKKESAQTEDADGSLFVFHNTRWFTYKIVRGCLHYEELLKKVRDYIVNLNIDFALGLTEGRIRSDAKSIVKWVWERRLYFIQGSIRFSERQRARAYKSHKSRKQNNEEKIRAAVKALKKEQQKVTQLAVAQKTELSRQTVSKYFHLFKKC